MQPQLVLIQTGIVPVKQFPAITTSFGRLAIVPQVKPLNVGHLVRVKRHREQLGQRRNASGNDVEEVIPCGRGVEGACDLKKHS